MEKPEDMPRRALRRAIADYMQSEGCSCCQNREKHEAAKAKIAKLLRVPKWKDGSGYNFNKFATKPIELEP